MISMHWKHYDAGHRFAASDLVRQRRGRSPASSLMEAKMKTLLFAAAALALVAGTAVAPAMAAIAPATAVSQAYGTTNAAAPHYVWEQGIKRNGQPYGYWALITPDQGSMANYRGFHTPTD